MSDFHENYYITAAAVKKRTKKLGSHGRPITGASAYAAPGGDKKKFGAPPAPQMALKLDNGKVGFYSVRTDRVTQPSSTVLVYIYALLKSKNLLLIFKINFVLRDLTLRNPSIAG